MEAEPGHRLPGFTTLLGRLGRTAFGALVNRGELLKLEWQEERARLVELLVWAVGLIFFVMMTVVLLTATILLLVPEDYRVYAAAGFTILYALAAVGAWLAVRSLLDHEPFSESLAQLKKDRACLDSWD